MTKITIISCANVEHNTCTSVNRSEVPDMRLGDICVLCACWDCERCGKLIDLDCEVQIDDGWRGPPGGGGYWAVCEGCVLESDTMYGFNNLDEVCQ